MRRPVGFVLACLALACSSEQTSAPSTTGAGGGTGGGAGPGGAGGTGAGGEACTLNEMPILVSTPGEPGTGEIGGMLVPVTFEGEERMLAVDTGSALTFLYLGEDGPDYQPYAGTIQLGCESIDLPGRGFSPDSPEIVGVLGANLIIGQHGVWDTVALRWQRYLDDDRPEPNGDATVLPFENVLDHMVVTLDVEGAPLRLMYDTGSPHLLWVGVDGEPGDQAQYGQDIEGNTFVMYFGTADVAVATEPVRELAAWRAPTFPYFERFAHELGVAGLAGQSTLGPRRMVFDPDASVVHLSPRAE
jgi:hypothetical protein